MKIWTLLLALLLALSLTACGGKQNDGGVTGTNNGAQTGGTANNNATGSTNGNTNGNGTDSTNGNTNGNGTGSTNGNTNGNGIGSANGNTNGNGTGSANGNGTVNGSNDANGNVVPGDIDGNGDSLLNPGGDKNNAANSGTAGNNTTGNNTTGNNTTGNTANAQDNGNPVRQSHSGWKAASFDQMVRNGRVHDRDGVLTDFENSVTPGSSHF